MKKILITGSKGFIGKNLISQLRNQGYEEIFEYDIHTEPWLLETYTKECDFVFHLAGVNRPKRQEEFMEGNFQFTVTLLEHLRKNHNTCTIVMASSIQASYDNSYGKSKKAGEDLLFAYSKESGAKVVVYRFANIFGKWCKPNYNSVVATFCYNISRGLPIQVNQPKTLLHLIYIDDVVEALILELENKDKMDPTFGYISNVYKITLGSLAELIRGFKTKEKTLGIPNVSHDFEKKLYSTYLSYLSVDHFSYPLLMHSDDRGSFTEFIKTPDRGQFSVNITKPGVTKGNHWHHTKVEKFLVVQGRGLIQLRKVDTEERIEYYVTGENMEVVNIPVGYAHNISNIGNVDLITFMWSSEVYHPKSPDTYFLKV